MWYLLSLLRIQHICGANFGIVIWFKCILLYLQDDAQSCTLQNDTCPAGYCCVRDDFLFTYTYCKPLGKQGSSCTTTVTDYECPCLPEFSCTSNIQGSAHVSLFGKCQAANSNTTNAPNAVGTGATSSASMSSQNISTTQVPIRKTQTKVTSSGQLGVQTTSTLPGGSHLTSAKPTSTSFRDKGSVVKPIIG